MESKDLIRCIHMFDSGKAVLAFAEGKSRIDFDRDRQFYSAVIRELSIIGEAANQISEATKSRFPAIPWKEIIGMRNRLIHIYFDLDHDVIWNTVIEYVPALLEQLKEVVPALKTQLSAEEVAAISENQSMF